MTDAVWPDERTEQCMIEDADLLISEYQPTSAGHDAACHIKALLCRVRELEGRRDVLEAAIVRTRTGWCNALELGIIPRRHEEQTRQIISELTAALAQANSRRTVG